MARPRKSKSGKKQSDMYDGDIWARDREFQSGFYDDDEDDQSFQGKSQNNVDKPAETPNEKEKKKTDADGYLYEDDPNKTLNSISLYFKEMGEIPLITQEVEVQLSKELGWQLKQDYMIAY